RIRCRASWNLTGWFNYTLVLHRCRSHLVHRAHTCHYRCCTRPVSPAAASSGSCFARYKCSRLKLSWLSRRDSFDEPRPRSFDQLVSIVSTMTTDDKPVLILGKQGIDYAVNGNFWACFICRTRRLRVKSNIQGVVNIG